jgi:hypothetical protein
MKQDVDDTDWEICDEHSEHSGESTWSFNVVEDHLDNEQ